MFLGDTNRTISETPMNMASSRSHCVFTIYVEARQVPPPPALPPAPLLPFRSAPTLSPVCVAGHSFKPQW